MISFARETVLNTSFIHSKLELVLLIKLFPLAIGDNNIHPFTPQNLGLDAMLTEGTDPMEEPNKIIFSSAICL